MRAERLCSELRTLPDVVLPEGIEADPETTHLDVAPTLLGVALILEVARTPDPLPEAEDNILVRRQDFVLKLSDGNS